MTELSPIERVGRVALDGVIEVVLGANLWSKQVEICRALSKPNAQVVVPACWASGKSFLGGRIPLAYHLTYVPSKVVITSSREDQLEDVLWSELRGAYHNAIIDFPGHLPPREMRLYASGEHFVVGHSPARPEGLKGYHAKNILVVVDEGSYMPPDMGQAVMSLVATGSAVQGTDARLLVLLNPTDAESWAAQLTLSPNVVTIPITAFDTPGLAHLTAEQIAERWGEESFLDSNRVPRREPSPAGAALISPEHLDSMVAQGNGPGTMEWETGVMARFWSAGTNHLVPRDMYDAALARTGTDGPYNFGVDLAAGYGDSESVVAVRKGNVLVGLEARTGMFAEDFLRSVVKPMADAMKPAMVVYDADGPGAGVARLAKDLFGGSAFGFRGGYKWGMQFLNTRSAWWWKIRHRFLTGDIAIERDDMTLRRQLLAMRFDHNSLGQLRVIDKHTLHRRGMHSIDRADALCYAFAYDTANVTRSDVSAEVDPQAWGRVKRKNEAAKKNRTGYVVMPRGGVYLPKR